MFTEQWRIKIRRSRKAFPLSYEMLLAAIDALEVEIEETDGRSADGLLRIEAMLELIRKLEQGCNKVQLNQSALTKLTLSPAQLLLLYRAMRRYMGQPISPAGQELFLQLDQTVTSFPGWR